MAGTLMRQPIHAAERQLAALPSAPASGALPAPFPASRQGAHSLKRQARRLRSPVVAAATAVAERPTVSFAQQTPEAVAEENVATQKPTVRASARRHALSMNSQERLTCVAALRRVAAAVHEHVQQNLAARSQP